MDSFEATVRVKPNFGSKSKSKSPEPKVPASTHDAYEWVAHGDVSARKRARAHVTKGVRRQKAEAAQSVKTKSASAYDKSQSSSPEAIHTENVVDSLSSQLEQQQIVNTVIPVTEDVQDVGLTMQDFVLVKSVGMGKTDPFKSLPITLDANEHTILEHFLFGVAPVSYNLDSRSDFSPVKALSFQVALGEPSAFHMIIAVGASDMAVLHGKEDSAEALKHRGKSIALVNQRLMKGDTSNAAIAGIALLAGNELLFGTPRNFTTHMNGLAQLLQLRGGIEALRDDNRALFHWISWVDYAGACNFVCRRKFLPHGPSNAGPCTESYGCPEALMASLPGGYDLFEYVTNTFRRYELMVPYLASPDPSLKMQELAAFVRRIDQELYTSLSLPNIKGSKGRRQYIQQSMHLLSLISGAVFSRVGTDLGEVLFGRFDAVFDGEGRKLLGLFGDLCFVMINGSRLNEQTLHARVAQILDACGPWAWKEWQLFKAELLDFFLEDDVCRGPLQTLWKHRMAQL